MSPITAWPDGRDGGWCWRDEDAGDDAFMRRLYRSVREPELAQTSWPEAARQAFCDSQFDLQRRHYRTHYPCGHWGVIGWQGQDVGRLYLDLSPARWGLMDIALLPERRGQGLGGRILGWFLAQADAAGVPCGLYVEQHNPARRLYERLGFGVDAEQGVYTRMSRPVGGGGLNPG